MKVNGEICTLKAPVSLSSFLADKGYGIGRIAVELNGAIVPKSAYDTTLLSDADTMEIVHFVGGG